jgi:hypothetical protein
MYYFYLLFKLFVCTYWSGHFEYVLLIVFVIFLLQFLFYALYPRLGGSKHSVVLRCLLVIDVCIHNCYRSGRQHVCIRFFFVVLCLLRSRCLKDSRCM